MSTLESRLEKAKKAVELAKDALQKAKPAGQSQRDFENGMNMFPNDYSDGVEAKKKLEVAKARLGRAEVNLHNSKLKNKKVKKGGKTRRVKGGSKKTCKNGF
jgi:hypothetical protein